MLLGGSVRVAVQGIVALDDKAGSGSHSSQAIHVSLVVANLSQEAWSVVPMEQRIEVTSGEEVEILQPVAAESAGIAILPGATRRMDFYFRLPVELAEASELPTLNTIWVVRMGDRLATRRTSFERFRYVVSPSPDQSVP